MYTPRIVRLGALNLIAVTTAAFGGPLLAQGTAAQAQVQLAFGYECDDRFLVRNDGAQAVTIEYSVAGSPERSQLQLAGKQQVEISSPSQGALELRVGGKVVSTAHKGNTICTPAQQDVVVRPLDQRDQASAAQPQPQQQAAQQPVYQQQPVYSPSVVVDPYPVYDPYYYGYGYPYYGYAYPYPYFGLGIGFYGHVGGYGYRGFGGFGRGVIARGRR